MDSEKGQRKIWDNEMYICLESKRRGKEDDLNLFRSVVDKMIIEICGQKGAIETEI